jgi:hypothetical protein
MDRKLVNAQAEFTITYTVNGVPTDPAPLVSTVTITRADGTPIITNGSATPAGASFPGTFLYSLTPGQNNQLDRLTATWTSSLGTIPTVSEIVGGFLIDAETLKALYPTESNSELSRRRLDVETRLERACGRAFVPRYEQEYVSIDRRGRARLRWGSVRLVRSIAVAGYGYSTQQISSLTLDTSNGMLYGLPYNGRFNSVFVAYEHGAEYFVGDVGSTALTALKETYGPDKIDSRIRSKSVDNVRISYGNQFSTEGSTQNLPFSSPDVVSFILDNRRPLIA